MDTGQSGEGLRSESTQGNTKGNLYRTLTGQSQQSTPDHDPNVSNVMTNSSTTDPLSGTLNHLTPQQEEALEQFKKRLEKDGWWKRDVGNGKASHDDGTLLRYLRARKFNVDGAIGQFTDTEKWLKDQKVEELYEHFDVDFYEKARTMYPQWTGRRDRRGIPLYVYVIKHLDGKNVSKYEKESKAYKASLPSHKNLQTPAKLLPLFALYHNLLNFVLPMVSTLERPNPEVPVTNSTNIVDISGVGLTQFWNLKAHMQEASVLATAHYPETLDRIFIIGAPGFFPTVWGWIKRWFDPVTVSKIFILSKHDVQKTLSSFIEPENIPKRYGGTLQWDFGDLPSPDAAILAALESDGSKGWIQGPCLWLDHKRMVVGSQNGKPRRSDKEVAQLKPVVYAADYTEEPVHPDRRASIVAAKSQAKPALPVHESHANGAAITPKEEAGAAAAAATAATVAPVATMATASTPQFQAQPTSSNPPQPFTTAPHQDPISNMPIPNPVSTHQTTHENTMVTKTEDESISTIPKSANGVLPHPESTTTSDKMASLSISAADGPKPETDTTKPKLERFVTAAEF